MIQKHNRPRYRGFAIAKLLRFQFRRPSKAGFSLTEVLVALMVVGILAAIAAPGWLGLHTNNLLNATREEAFQVIRQTQVRATQTHQFWQVSFREQNRQVEWAAYRSGASATIWQPLGPSGVQISHDQTTLSQTAAGYFVEFNNRGNVMPPFGRLTFSSSRGGSSRRCVFVSNLLGTVRKAADEDCGVL